MRERSRHHHRPGVLRRAWQLASGTWSPAWRSTPRRDSCKRRHTQTDKMPCAMRSRRRPRRQIFDRAAADSAQRPLAAACDSPRPGRSPQRTPAAWAHCHDTPSVAVMTRHSGLPAPAALQHHRQSRVLISKARASASARLLEVQRISALPPSYPRTPPAPMRWSSWTPFYARRFVLQPCGFDPSEPTGPASTASQRAIFSTAASAAATLNPIFLTQFVETAPTRTLAGLARRSRRASS